MATKQETVDEILNYPVKKAKEATRPLNQRIAEAVAKGDKEALSRLNLEAGTRSAGIGLFTGLPDLAVAGYNWLAGKDVKDLRTRVLEASDIPTKASGPEYDLTYNAPEYAVMAYSVGQLGKALVNSGKSFIQNRKATKLLDSLVDAGDLEKADVGFLRKVALTGQGSDSPQLNAIFNRLKDNNKFTELFTTLEKEAVDLAVKGMKPAASKLNEPDATKHAVEAITGKLDTILEAKKTAGDVQFGRARSLIGDNKAVFSTDSTLKTIDELSARYAAKGDDSSKAIVKWLGDLKEQFQPTITTTATKGTTVTTSPTVGDTLMNISAKAGGTYNIPGSSGYTTKASPRNLTLDEVTGRLKEWGAVFGNDGTLVKDASPDAVKAVYKALFGSLSDDMRSAAKAANAAGDIKTQKGIEAAIQGRGVLSKIYGAYDDAIAQGVPKWLQGKNINEISFEDLYGVYSGLNPSQRAIFRGYLGDTGGEALKAIDSKVYQDFISGAKRTLDDGTYGIDPAALAAKWKDLSKDKNTVDALSQALGTNAAEFEKRMNSLYAFTRRMQTTAEKADSNLVSKIAPDVGRAAGMSSYAAKQGVDIAADVWKKMTMGVSDDMLMKILLTDEAKGFLKTAGMTKGSRNVLDELDSLYKANYKKPVFLGASSTAQTINPSQPELSLPDDLSLPPDLMGTEGLSLPDDLSLPPDLLGTSPSSSVVQPTSDTVTLDGQTFPADKFGVVTGQEQKDMLQGINLDIKPTRQDTDVNTSSFIPPTMAELQAGNPRLSSSQLFEYLNNPKAHQIPRGVR